MCASFSLRSCWLVWETSKKCRLGVDSSFGPHFLCSRVQVQRSCLQEDLGCLSVCETIATWKTLRATQYQMLLLFPVWIRGANSYWLQIYCVNATYDFPEDRGEKKNLGFHACLRDRGLISWNVSGMDQWEEQPVCLNSLLFVMNRKQDITLLSIQFTTLSPSRPVMALRYKYIC